MKPIYSIAAAIAILAAATAHAQTVKSLGFNASNNVVVGPTNTNALVFTNQISAHDISVEFINSAVTMQGDVTIAKQLYFPDDTNAFLVFEAGETSAAAVTSRSNLFGAAGLSATITNGSLVFVFTNGILASTNAP